MSKLNEKIGKRIQKARKQTGYTQEELAEKLRISRTHMGHIEQGRKTASLELLEKAAKYLNISLKDLF